MTSAGSFQQPLEYYTFFIYLSNLFIIIYELIQTDTFHCFFYFWFPNFSCQTNCATWSMWRSTIIKLFLSRNAEWSSLPHRWWCRSASRGRCGLRNQESTWFQKKDRQSKRAFIIFYQACKLSISPSFTGRRCIFPTISGKFAPLPIQRQSTPVFFV